MGFIGSPERSFSHGDNPIRPRLRQPPAEPPVVRSAGFHFGQKADCHSAFLGYSE
jgi:hypothetical protein